MPRSRWIMTQTWHDVLFAHWPVERAVLEARLPRSCPLDLFDGQAWLGIVAFEMSNVAPRLVPALPWLSAFAEINVRTYVRVDDKPGVYFFSLDATNPIAVWLARRFFHLPYHTAAIEVVRKAHTVGYSCRRRNAEARFDAIYGPAGAAAEAVAGSLEYFLTERYCLYTVDAANRLLRCDIHHPPWPLQPATATIGANTLAEAAGISLPPIAPVVHFSKRQDTVNWPLSALTTS
jgi:uncharacterized protein YqjF (DUF2071 family)